jgi:tRNA nucleotidyltransferase (CCA-adding enzyme)
MRFQPPAYVLKALALLHTKGYEAYLVGGCVRDACLDRTAEDYDIATSAAPDETRAVFSAYRQLLTGIQHGSLTILMEGRTLEVTTFRTEGAYADGRHPDKVRFTQSIDKDLLRRDFTVNAMAWQPETGLYDPLNGSLDCGLRLLRAVGQAAKRFEEDALRILRALRFASQLGFEIETETLRAMMDKAGGLQRVSMERVAHELNRTLLGDHAARAFRAYHQVLFLALPELSPLLHTPQRTPFHCCDVWEHSLRTLEGTPKDLALRWAALYHDSGKPGVATYDPGGTTHFSGHQRISAKIAGDAMLRLKQPRVLNEEVVSLVQHYDERIGPDNLRLLLSHLGRETMDRLLLLQRADMAAHAPKVAAQVHKIDRLINDVARLVQQGAALNLKDLAVDGADLISLGFRQDASLGTALQRLLHLVLSGQIDNERGVLLRAAEDLLKEE